MKSTGIVRRIDALGRIVLPIELRKNLKIDTNTPLEMFVDGESILLKKYRPVGSCDFCGEVSDDVIDYCGTNICAACRHKIGAL